MQWGGAVSGLSAFLDSLSDEWNDFGSGRDTFYRLIDTGAMDALGQEVDKPWYVAGQHWPCTVVCRYRIPMECWERNMEIVGLPGVSPIMCRLEHGQPSFAFVGYKQRLFSFTESIQRSYYPYHDKGAVVHRLCYAAEFLQRSGAELPVFPSQEEWITEWMSSM